MTPPLDSVLVLLAIAACGFSASSAMLVGGAINARLNLRQPSDASRRWGWILGAINLAQGGVGLFLFFRLVTEPMADPPAPDVYLLIGAGTVAALAIGALDLFAAKRAQRTTGADHGGGNTPA